MLLYDIPRQEFGRLIFAVFHIEALREAVLDFIAVCNCGVGIETDEALEIIDARDFREGADIVYPTTADDSTDGLQAMLDQASDNSVIMIPPGYACAIFHARA